MSHQSGETVLCVNIKYGEPQGQLFLWVLQIPHGSCSLSMNSRDLRKRCQVKGKHSTGGWQQAVKKWLCLQSCGPQWLETEKDCLHHEDSSSNNSTLLILVVLLHCKIYQKKKKKVVIVFSLNVVQHVHLFSVAGSPALCVAGACSICLLKIYYKVLMSSKSTSFL